MNVPQFDKKDFWRGPLLYVTLACLPFLVYSSEYFEKHLHFFHCTELTELRITTIFILLLPTIVLLLIAIKPKIQLKEIVDSNGEKINVETRKINFIKVIICSCVFLLLLIFTMKRYRENISELHCSIDKTEFKETYNKINDSVYAKFDSIAISTSPFNKTSIADNIQGFTNSIIDNNLKGKKLNDKEFAQWKDSLTIQFKHSNFIQLKTDSLIYSALSFKINNLPSYSDSVNFIYSLGDIMDKNKFKISDTAKIIAFEKDNPNNGMYFKSSNFKYAIKQLFYNRSNQNIQVIGTTTNSNFEIDTLFINYK